MTAESIFSRFDGFEHACLFLWRKEGGLVPSTSNVSIHISHVSSARFVSRSGANVATRPRGWRELRARASSAGARLSVVFFLRARYILASFVFIE